jgi:hypothetical protein
MSGAVRVVSASRERGQRVACEPLDYLCAIRALESAGVEFIADHGGGAGVRLRK